MHANFSVTSLLTSLEAPELIELIVSKPISSIESPASSTKSSTDSSSVSVFSVPSDCGTKSWMLMDDKPIGRGGFGEVWKATTTGSQFYALKFVSKFAVPSSH